MKTGLHAGRSCLAGGFAAACLAFASPALAQTEAPGELTVSGSVGLVTDYRFRGVSQTDEEMAVQGGVTVKHASGLYVGTWASNLAGWGTFGGSNMELDIYGGYSTEVMSGLTLDVGLTWYMYPGGASETDFAEPYVKVSGDLGPASVLVGAAYAPKQEALGRVYNSGASYVAGIPDNPGAKSDNLYLWTDASLGVPNTPLTLKGHFGYSNGNAGLGPNGTSVAPTGEYLDWMLGADLAVGPVTLGVAYVDTDISSSDAAYLQPNFSSTKDGSSIAGSTVLFSLSAGF
ncbi:MAG TPA: TorF family putative porin [Novosphingobium sp.]|nr:TorF family putative porin [Novosphingobium sp.]